MTRLRSAVQAMLRSWGLVPTPAPRDDLHRKIDVLLSLPDGQRLVVGTLSYAHGEFVFQYSEAFKAQSVVPPIAAFPDPQEDYRSSVLWPFFEVRLPPVHRADVQRFIAERNIDPNDHVRMHLRRRCPDKLRLRRPRRAGSTPSARAASPAT